MVTVNICMSGGRTSAYLTEQVLRMQHDGYMSHYNFVITFANTSREHINTLDFINKCDARWSELYNQNIVWLEAVVHSEKKPSSHKIVNFKTACRDGEVFESVVKKYGLPNNNFLHCTRELKENPIISYMKSIGQKPGYIKDGKLVCATYQTWIGIRADEPKRLTGNKNGKQQKYYPLAEKMKDFPHDIICEKDDVLSFWEDQEFDLELPEHLGNCVDCHKKSFKKLNLVLQDMGEKEFDFSKRLDTKYSHIKAQKTTSGLMNRKRFRGYKDTNELIQMLKISEFQNKDTSNETGGCTESCEPFMTENKPMASPNSRRNSDAREDDLYTTPKWAIDAILKREELDGITADAGCGTGNITNAMIDFGIDECDIITIDKFRHNYQPDIVMDYCKWNPYDMPCNVISNPPFTLLIEFIKHSLKIASHKVLIFARINALESKDRYNKIFKDNPPTRIYQFVNRVSCPKGQSDTGGNAVMYCWLVWDHCDVVTGTSFDWIEDKAK